MFFYKWFKHGKQAMLFDSPINLLVGGCKQKALFTTKAASIWIETSC